MTWARPEGANRQPGPPLKPCHFPQHKLRVYPLALDLAVACRQLAAALPRGNGPLGDQLKRASAAVPLLLAEGINRRTPAQERQRFVEARGEVGEVAACLELIACLQLVPETQVEPAWNLATQVHPMLSKLLARYR